MYMANPRSVTVGLGVNRNRGAKQGLGGLGVPRTRTLATTKGAARSGRRRKARWWRQAGSIRMDPGANVAGRQPARLKKLLCLTRSTPPSGFRGARCRRRKGEAAVLTEGGAMAARNAGAAGELARGAPRAHLVGVEADEARGDTKHGGTAAGLGAGGKDGAGLLCWDARRQREPRKMTK